MDQSVAPPIPSPEAASPEAGSRFGSLAILGAFCILALVIIAALWSSYQLTLHVQRGGGFANSFQYARAIPDLEYVLQRSPEDKFAQTSLGWCYIQTDQPAKALKIWQDVQRQDPDAKVDDMLGLCYLGLNEPDKAYPLLAAALKDSPDGPNANFGMGRYYMMKGEPLLAGHYFQSDAKHPEWDPGLDHRTAMDIQSDPYRRQLRQMVLGTAAATSATTSTKR